jgi:hypothetical protein
MRSRAASTAAEGAVTAIAGGALGALTGSLVDLTWIAAAVGAINGAFGGARATYRWRSPWGWLAFLLDSTWSLPMTAAGLVAHGVAAIQRRQPNYVEDLSRRRNRHVYIHGLQARRGFVLTLGNVISGAGPRVVSSDRRRKLITDHEDVHVWQARWFGVLYPVLYVAWTVAGGVVGAALWALRRRDEPIGKVMETCGYYLNPFEWWAYSRDGFWPPAQKVTGMGWKLPAAQPFSATSRRLGRGRGASSGAPR